MSVTGMSKVFNVLPADSASGNNMLSALQLVDNQNNDVVLVPEFSPDTVEYYAVVPVSAYMVIATAATEDSSAKAEVLGGRDLQIGDNQMFVTVEAEDGTKRVYTIYVFRSELEEEVLHPNWPEVTMTPGTVLEQKEDGLFVTEYHTYTVCEKPDGITIPEGYVEKALLMGDITVTAYVKQGESSADYVLLVLKNAAGEINLYRYDRTEQTLQKMIQEEYTAPQNGRSNEELRAALQKCETQQNVLKQYEAQQVALVIAASLLGAVCVVLLIVILWLNKSRKNRG